MNSVGQHHLIELFGCSRDVLNDAPGLRSVLRAAAEAAGARIVGELIHPFSPHGVTALVLVEESHLSIHTWPESGYAAMDFYSCGDTRAEAAVQLVAQHLKAERIVSLIVERGHSPDTTLRISPNRS